jgi:hypothetical protein
VTFSFLSRPDAMMTDHNGVKPHTTVTVTTQSGLAPQDQAPMEIRLNIGYFKSYQGIVKLVQLVSTFSLI